MEAETGITSQALTRKPVLRPLLQHYYDEYGKISRDRRRDQGYPLPITTFEIMCYTAFYQVDDKEEFDRMIRMIDDAYLTEVYKREEAKRSK